MTIEFLETDEGGELVFPDDIYEASLRRFDAIQESYRGGEVNTNAYIQDLKEIILENPHFIDAYAHVGNYYFENREVDDALEYFSRAVAICETYIPKEFKGEISWFSHSNRAYLRAMHGICICYVSLQKHKEAIRAIKRMLSLNPSDDSGLRHLLGSEYLRLGKHSSARKIFVKGSETYPPLRYEMALSLMMEGEWVKAATWLRKGFIENPYIAEIICGHPKPMCRVIWHGTNLRLPETAHNYLSTYMGLWQHKEEYTSFTHWIYTHPLVVLERAEVLFCDERLAWENDPTKRGAVLSRRGNLVSAVSDELSEAIVRKRLSRNGESVWPWEYWNLDFNRVLL